MKKILLVATVQSHICQFHRPLVELLHEYEWEVHIAARNNLGEKNGLKLDFAEVVYDVPFCRSPFEIKNIKAYRQLKKIIDEGQYNIIHCNTPVGGILTRIAAKKVRKKGTKVYYTAHGFHFYHGAPVKNWLIYYPIEKLFARKTDKLITIVSEDYNIARKKFDCPVHRIHGVGVDEKKFYHVKSDEKKCLRKKLDLSEDKKIILCVGELLPNKNQKMIIQAMPKILKHNSDVLLLLAGNGSMEHELNTSIQNMGLQNNVMMLGYVTNIHEYHKASDLLVSCSIREGLGLNVIEAMLTGNPVVLTDNRGHRELIDNQNNGYIVSIKDVEKMAEAICKLLNSDKLYNRCANNSVKFSIIYTAEMVKKELKEIFEL